MIAFPEARRRAQAEIDAVVGHDRLPTFADTPRLPYVRAITRDILRWCPTIPSSYLTSRPIKTGAMARIFRKKGATCISDVWHRNHDQAVFGDDAEEFRPRRYLDEHGELLPGSIGTNQAGRVTFGSG